MKNGGAPLPTNEPISVSFNVSENYVQHLAVVAVSILTNAPRSAFVFHVLTREMSEATRARLARIERDCPRCRFEVHLVDFSLFENMPSPLEHVSRDARFRILLPQILAKDRRTIYMDVDVLVIGDITPLASVDLGDAMLGGVIDNYAPSKELMDYRTKELGLRPDTQYVNSGVLVMDLEKLRRFDFSSKCFATIERLRDVLSFVDQDTINIVAEGHIKVLPERWNCQNRARTLQGERPVIRHFTSFTNKPWCYIWKNRSWPLYLYYLLKTPYRDRAPVFAWRHVKGFFWYRFTKKGVERTLVFGLLVRKRKV